MRILRNLRGSFFVFGLRSLSWTEIIRFPLMGLSHFRGQCWVFLNNVFSFLFWALFDRCRNCLSFASIVCWILSLSCASCFNLKFWLDHLYGLPCAFKLVMIIILLCFGRSMHWQRPVSQHLDLQTGFWRLVRWVGRVVVRTGVIWVRCWSFFLLFKLLRLLKVKLMNSTGHDLFFFFSWLQLIQTLNRV